MIRANHWMQTTQCDNKRIQLMNDTGIPYGWVVNGNLAENLRQKLVAQAIPLKIGGFHLIARYKALRLKNQIEQKYSGKVLMLMVPHEDTESGWLASFVLLSDFAKKPSELRSEMSKALNNHHDSYLCRMKECLWLALTGRMDPE